MKLPRKTDWDAWQNLVDGAHACLALASAKLYGLVTGGPEIDQERCVKVLEHGRRLGFTPSPDAVDNFIRAWQEMHPNHAQAQSHHVTPAGRQNPKDPK